MAVPRTKPVPVLKGALERLQRFMTIGELERLAGIDTEDFSARQRFWDDFKHLPGTSGLDAGVRELLRIIERPPAGTRPVS